MDTLTFPCHGGFTVFLGDIPTRDRRAVFFKPNGHVLGTVHYRRMANRLRKSQERSPDDEREGGRSIGSLPFRSATSIIHEDDSTCHLLDQAMNTIVWHVSFFDPSKWWDKFDKPYLKAPDFKYNSTDEALWIEDWLKPCWVKEEVGAFPKHPARSGDGCDFGLGHGARRAEYNRPVTSITRLNQTHLSARHRSGLSGSSFKVTDGDLRTLCKEGRLEEAIHILDVMDQRGIKVNAATYACLLHGCINMKALPEGKRVHAHILQSRFKPNVFLGNSLVSMYLRCGSMQDARRVFDKMPERNVFSWNIMIAGYKHGRAEEAFELFEQMKQDGVKPSRVTFVSMLQACAFLGSLEHAKQIHAHIIGIGLGSDVFVGSALVDMYAKCGSIEHARQVFDQIRKKDVVLWNAMIKGYAENAHAEGAFTLFWQMEQEGLKPTEVTFLSMLKACSKLGALKEGKEMHARIIRCGFDSHIFVGSALVDMYAKCGSIDHARQVFDRLPRRDVVSWNSMITGYAQHGHAGEALKLFRNMSGGGMKPNKVTFLSMLKTCASLADLEEGKQIHACLIRSGFESDMFVGSTLIDMYARCGSIENARQVFDKILKRDVVSWTTMIAGYVQHGHVEEAFKLFWHMEQEGVQPDKVAFLSVLKACASIGALEEGKKIHAHIIKAGFESDGFVGSMLVDMYAKCGSIEHARQVFDKIPKRNVVSWNVMIAGYAQHGHAEESFKLFQQMEQEGIKPDEVTFVNVLKSCTIPAALKWCKQIHAHVIKSGLESDVFVGSALVDIYAKCGSIEHARQVFNGIPRRDIVLWNAMIAGYAEHGHAEDAFKLFWHLKQEGLRPSKATFLSILKACANVATLEQGKQFHAYIINCGFESDAFVASALVDMYAKCGSIEHARQVFDKIPQRDVVLWNVMIAGYAQHGHGKDALKLLKEMQQEGAKLDNTTFICILYACSHAGLVDEGRDFFDYLSQDPGIMPTAEHYACMVDLLGRAGHMEEAMDFIKRMPFVPNAVVWTALLGACRTYGNVELAKYATECIYELEPQSAAPFVQLSNIYAVAGRWDDRAEVINMMEDIRYIHTA